MMHNVIYLSAASYLFSDEELIAFLNKSRANNIKLGITGLLLYNEGSILQILEGEKQVVTDLYKIIERDNRHTRIVKMIDASITQRSFSDWSMGFKRVSDADWSQLKGYLDIDKDNKICSGTESNSVITMIKSFADINRLDIDTCN